MRLIVCFILFCAAPVWAEALASDRIESDGSNVLLKSIDENMGNRLLRAVVIDSQGHEQHILLKADDVVEKKRGLWLVRAGTYPLAL